MQDQRTVYFDHELSAEDQPNFPCGEAGTVGLDARTEWRGEWGDECGAPTEVWISPNSHCALVCHGVAEALTALPATQGQVGSGRDALVLPGTAEDVARIFYAADRKTYGARYDFLVAEVEVPERVDYRIAIDNREYQRTLSRLQFLATTAAHYGRGLRLKL